MQEWNPQKPTELDGNDTTTLSHHPYILCHFAATYTNIFVSCVRVVEGGGVDSAESEWSNQRPISYKKFSAQDK